MCVVSLVDLGHCSTPPPSVTSSSHASNGVGVHAAGDTKDLYAVDLGNSDDSAESGDSETHLAEVAMADVGQENGGDQVDFGGKKQPLKKKPVLTVSL